MEDLEIAVAFTHISQKHIKISNFIYFLILSNWKKMLCQ